VYDPLEPDKKVEPFYFDARRGASALPIDIGFSPDALPGMTNTTHPAVEYLCLVGLQRHRPMPGVAPRVFDYHTWTLPLDARVTPAAVCGVLRHVGGRRFRFENAFRTDQRKYHKAFTPATPLARSST
jgi:CRISPR-associated protein Csb3